MGRLGKAGERGRIEVADCGECRAGDFARKQVPDMRGANVADAGNADAEEIHIAAEIKRRRAVWPAFRRRFSQTRRHEVDAGRRLPYPSRRRDFCNNE
jgi:hypothetical protein